jgi:hypothetical protein
MQWGRRANSVLQIMNRNAILYVAKEPIVGDEIDWLTNAIFVTSSRVRDKVEDLVVLVTHYGEPSFEPNLPSLTEMMRI